MSEKYYLISGDNLQSITVWGTTQQAELYMELCNRDQEINCYSILSELPDDYEDELTQDLTSCEPWDVFV